MHSCCNDTFTACMDCHMLLVLCTIDSGVVGVLLHTLLSVVLLTCVMWATVLVSQGFSEKSDKPLSFGHNSPDGQGQVPTVMNEPLPEAPTLLLSLHKKRSRTMSYPTDRSAHAIPLLELPSQPKLSQPDASTSEKDVMETSLVSLHY